MKNSTEKYKMFAYMFMEYIKSLRMKFVCAVFALNGMLNAATYQLQELILIEVSKDTGCNFSHQHNQQKAEEL